MISLFSYLSKTFEKSWIHSWTAATSALPASPCNLKFFKQNLFLKFTNHPLLQLKSVIPSSSAITDAFSWITKPGIFFYWFRSKTIQLYNSLMSWSYLPVDSLFLELKILELRICVLFANIQRMTYFKLIKNIIYTLLGRPKCSTVKAFAPEIDLILS